MTREVTGGRAEPPGPPWPGGYRGQDGGDQAGDRYARAALSYLAEPGDVMLGALLRQVGPSRVLSAILADDPAAAAALPWPACDDDRSARAADRSARAADRSARAEDRPAGTGDRPPGTDGRLSRAGIPPAGRRAIGRWRLKAERVPTPARLAVWADSGYRLICPADPEWPTQLDDLGDARPIVLWARGSEDLRFAAIRSVAIVGARAATAYGSHVAAEIAAGLAGRGWTVISGGAYGIDAAAHRGALAVGAATVAVLASGLRFGYPKGHADLFAKIRGSGVMVSENPPDQAPSRPGFLVRNRVIAALSRGTVVVEAAIRSGALNTARHARELNRPVMAVPGPVTSTQSAGCHELIRDWAATCVTGVDDVIELVAPLGADLASGAYGGAGESGRAGAGDGPAGVTRRLARGTAGSDDGRVPVVPAEDLDPVTASVLRAVPIRQGRGPASIATLAGVDLDTVLRCLGLLAACGHVERCELGWRIRRGGS
ncbi:MAG: DNA-processing protein DprA [Streptosporangiaceae bacterium]